MPTWTNEQILRWMKDAEDDIVAKVYMRFESFSIAIESGTALYTLNRRIYRPVKLMWKGKEISPYIGREIHATSPQFRTVQGEPTAYQMFGDGVTQLRLIPVPDTSIAEYTTGLYDTNIENAFIIRAYTFPDTDVDYFQIPDYVYRNLVKCYVLYRAFNSEGIGQNLKAAEFWSSRYDYLMGLLAKARGKYYNGKERLDNDFFLSQRKRRHARLPGDFTISKPVFPLVSVASSGFTLSDSVELSLELGEGFLLEGGSGDLNNWLDAAVPQIYPGPLAASAGDDLNNWNDAIASEIFGALSQSFSDTLNNWSDAAVADNAVAGAPPTSTWLFDEGSGSTANDSSSSNDGTISGSPTWVTEGLQTDATTSISMGNVLDNDGTTPFSVSIVFEQDNQTAVAGMMVEKMGGNSGPGYAIISNLGITRTISIDIASAYGGTNPYLQVRSPFPTHTSNTWLHFMVTYSGSGTAAGVKMYVNGSAVTPVVARDTFSTTASNSGNHIIGDGVRTAYNCFVGTLGIVRHWSNKELSATEVSDWYTTDQTIMSGRGVTI